MCILARMGGARGPLEQEAGGHDTRRVGATRADGGLSQADGGGLARLGAAPTAGPAVSARPAAGSARQQGQDHPTPRGGAPHARPPCDEAPVEDGQPHRAPQLWCATPSSLELYRDGHGPCLVRGPKPAGKECLNVIPLEREQEGRVSIKSRMRGLNDLLWPVIAYGERIDFTREVGYILQQLFTC